MVKTTKLKNNLRVVTQLLPNTNSITVLILVGAGSRYEKLELNGISHFLEHMFFKGAKKYKNTKEVSEAIDSVGGDFNAFTGKEYAGYFVKVSADKYDVAINVLADMLIDARLDIEEIEKERGVILEEYNMYQDTPMYQIGWDFERLIYGDQPMGRDQIGTKELIKSVSQQDFLNYLNDLYTPDNTVIAIAGNFEEEKIIKDIENLFVFPNSRENKKLSFEPIQSLLSEKKVWLRDKKTEQAHIVIGFPGFAAQDEKLYASKLLAVIMGGNMSSRLFLAVREAQGLAYYINANTDDYTDTGIWSVSAGVTVEKIDQAIKSTINEFEKVVREGILIEELEKAKSFLKGKMVLRLEDSEEYAHLIGKYALLQNQEIGVEDIIKKIDAVTLNEINQVAKELFKEDLMRMAVIGPYDDQKHFVNLLKFD